MSLSLSLLMRRLDACVQPLPQKTNASFSLALTYCFTVWRASSLMATVCLPLADYSVCVLAYIGITLSRR